MLVQRFAWLTVGVMVVLATLCAFFSLSHRQPAEAIVKSAPQVDIGTASAMEKEPTDDSQGAIDLFGNDVTDAVARYRFDASGSLYEVHSPQTEIPKLRPPKS